MARVHTVKQARKDYPEIGVQKGETYYWYKQKIMSGGGWYSKLTRTKTYPKPEDMMQSEYQKAVRAIQNMTWFTSATSFSDLESARDEIVSELESLKQEQEEKLVNMPEGLREGSVGQLLQERAEQLEGVIDELGSVDIPTDEDAEAEDEEGVDTFGDRLQNTADELQDALGGL